jgi:hypothetical protein
MTEVERGFFTAFRMTAVERGFFTAFRMTAVERGFFTAFRITAVERGGGGGWRLDDLAEDDGGLDEGSGDAAGDGEEVARGGEDFDERGLGELRDVDLHAVADAADGLLVDDDGGHFGKE